MTASMRRRHGSVTLVMLVLMGLVAAGCGVPSHTAVEVDNVSGPDTELANSGVPRIPPGPDEADEPRELVEHFLTAAAADPDNAAEELRPFVHSDQRDTWKPDPQVTVVRVENLVPTPGPTTRIELTVRPLGTLANGMVEPRAGQDARTFEFQVTIDPSLPDPAPVAGEGPRYRIVDPPGVIMLDETALATGTFRAGYLQPTSVYFWDSDSDVLVPDLRWIPTALAAGQRIQAKLEWLTDGPASWLESLARLPGELELESNPVLREDRLEVALTGTTESADRERLDSQLWWTLRDELGTTPISLNVNGQQREIVAHQRVRQAIPHATPPSFVVLNGAVVAYAPSGDTTLPADAVAPGAQALALTGDGDDVALAQAHPDGNGEFRLSIFTEEGLHATDLPPAGEMSRPVWLRRPGHTGLVAADGDLYRFTADGATHPMAVPTVAAGITHVAVAPDGRRVAMIAGNGLYTASLVRRGDGSVSLNQPRRLPTSAAELSGVAFVQENWLAIIGRDAGGESQLYEITVDGAQERVLRDGSLGAPQTISHMVGYPGDPFSGTPRGGMMWQQDGLAYRYDFPQGRRLPIVAEEFEIELPDDSPAELRTPFFRE